MHPFALLHKLTHSQPLLLPMLALRQLRVSGSSVAKCRQVQRMVPVLLRKVRSMTMLHLHLTIQSPLHHQQLSPTHRLRHLHPHHRLAEYRTHHPLQLSQTFLPTSHRRHPPCLLAWLLIAPSGTRSPHPSHGQQQLPSLPPSTAARGAPTLPSGSPIGKGSISLMLSLWLGLDWYNARGGHAV